MKIGDLLLTVPGSSVPPGTRYSQGLVIDVDPIGQVGIVMIAWFDGRVQVEEVSYLKKYYVRISRVS